MSKVRAIVLTGFGINCEEEMSAAYRLAGAHADVVHLNDVLLEKVSIHDYQILNFPGGFSFGDDLGSGKVLANKLRYKTTGTNRLFFDEVERFLGDGKFVMGVCNGFQALVKMGLLPNVTTNAGQDATLTTNRSGKFEDRWVTCRTFGNDKTPFLTGIDNIDLPIRHGEGRLILASDEVKELVEAQGLNCLTYVDASNQPTAEYPLNPNGSDLNCAGLTDKTGQILGLMPHPEAYLSLYNHPNWPLRRRNNPELSEDGEGLKLFTNIVEHIARTAL